MKKNSMIVKSVMIALGLVGAAHADDKSWTGFYAGVNSGLVLNNAQLSSQQSAFNSPSGTCNATSNFSNGSMGVQWGYLHAFPNLLVSGVEVNATVNNDQKHAFNCNSAFNAGVYDRFMFRNQMQASVKGRLGRPLVGHENILPYVTAGVTLARLGLAYENEGGDYYTNTASSLGGLMGGGVEWAFMPHWSLRAEYNFVDYGNVVKLRVNPVYGLDDPNGRGNVSLYSNNVFVAVDYWV